jgi:hypothetical protein
MSTHSTSQELDAARAKYRGEIIPADAASQKRHPDLIFQVANLSGQGRLRSMKLLRGGFGEASCLNHTNEIAQMTKFHTVRASFESMPWKRAPAARSLGFICHAS